MASVQFKTMQQMVADLYPGVGWKDRVYNHMSHEQVCAIYHRALEKGEFDKKKKKENKKIETENRKWYQLTIFDFLRKDEK